MFLSELFVPFVRSPAVLALWLSELDSGVIGRWVVCLGQLCVSSLCGFARAPQASLGRQLLRWAAGGDHTHRSVAAAGISAVGHWYWPVPGEPHLLLWCHLCAPRTPPGVRIRTDAAQFICSARALSIRASSHLHGLPVGLSGADMPVAVSARIAGGGVAGILVLPGRAQEEQSFRDSPYAAQYESYRSRTGMFFPRVARAFTK